MKGKLENVPYEILDIFNLNIPTSCPGVPASILNPKKNWNNEIQWFDSASRLAESFQKNFEKYADRADQETFSGSPETSLISA